jgi:para-nitrobenzyl esterase
MSVTQTTVRIDSGEIAGTESGDVRAYLGVPYAAPPVGPLRWRAPQPVVAWTGVRDCTRFGPDPMQIPEPVPIRRTRATSYSEDCLNLNVWAPAHPPAGGAPVIVYFDFGGFIAGSASRERTDGSNYARRGVVCVNVNHRYGVFGFLAHPALSAESEHGVSGNYGFLDTIRALEWVRDNIAAFGGDPGRVTVTGASAGAATSTLLLTSPLAKGLVHRMLFRSGSGLRKLHTLAQAEAAGRVIGDDLAALRAIPAGELLKMNAVVDPANHPDVEGVRPLLAVPYLRPILDGYALVRDDADAYRSGAFEAVPSIMGNVTNESGGHITAKIPIHTVAQLRGYLADSFGDAFEDAWKVFGAATDADVSQALVGVWNDNRYSYAIRGYLREIAKRQPDTYRYVFSHVGTHTANPPVHGNDMTYVFGTGDFDERDRAVSDGMMSAFCNFAATGNPNGPGAPNWPAYDPDRENYLLLDDGFPEGARWHTDQAAFIERYFQTHAG